MRALAGLAPLAGAILLFVVAQSYVGLTAPASFLGAICSAAGNDFARWTFDPWITAPLLGSGLLYLGGLIVLWSRAGAGRGALGWRAAAFGAGWLSLAFALVSPLHHDGTELFTAHMVEHEIVMAVAAPLLALARPGAVFLWALPRPSRHAIGRATRVGGIVAAWRVLTNPLVATILHGATIWAWHAPALFDAAVTYVPLHRLQHVSFLLTAILFWWAMMRRANSGAACGHLFVTMTHTGLLGALMTLAPRVLYHVQTAHSAAWGLSPWEDQQMAGLVMWIPAGAVYAGAALGFAARWIQRSGRTPAWTSDHAL